jgi:GNAT superfamily N-acetyltransferase
VSDDTATFVPPPLALLSSDHDTSLFDSGEPSLDSWLQQHAATAARRRLSATHVWAQPEGRVLGYVTLAAHSIGQDVLPRSLGHGFPVTIPAILLARLALHRNLRGQNLGAVLLAETLDIVAHSAANISAAFVVVDALNDAVMGFYRHYGFRELPNTRRMVLKTTKIPS